MTNMAGMFTLWNNVLALLAQAVAAKLFTLLLCLVRHTGRSVQKSLKLRCCLPQETGGLQVLTCVNELCLACTTKSTRRTRECKRKAARTADTAIDGTSSSRK